MWRLEFIWKLFFYLNILVLAVPSTVTDPDDEDEDEFDDSDESAEADDDGRIYKNPRNSPSSDCPRDEEQATLLGQKCLRKCSSHEDCKSKKKKCLCDGTCGMSCIKPGIRKNDILVFLNMEIIKYFSDRECPELPQPELGEVTLSGREFGAKATYSCPLGHSVIGVHFQIFFLFHRYLTDDKILYLFQLATRLCRNGIWTGSQPICSTSSMYLIDTIYF